MPGLLEWPAKVKTPRVVKMPCSTLDYFPTVLEVLGFKMKGQPAPIDGESALIIAISVAALVIGYLFTIETVRVGDLSVSAPFRYSLLLGAVAIGYVLFDEVPDALTVLGSCIIVASGIFAIYLDRQRTALTPT